jgi:hypothetical protein
MSTATRNDVHRPSAVIVEDYEFVGVALDRESEDIVGGAMLAAEERRRISAHMERTGGTYSTHKHGGNCHSCGAHCVYHAIFYHQPTGDYVRLGLDCTEKMYEQNQAAFQPIRQTGEQLRKIVGDARRNQAGKLKAELILSDAGLSRAWELHTDDNAQGNEIDTIRDMVRGLIKYGSISEKQEKFIGSLINRIDNRDQLEIERAAEKATADDCPTGRVIITGTVIKTEVRDGNYGTEYKMTVKDDRGFIAWGSIPGSLQLFDEVKQETNDDGTEDTWTEQRALTRGDRVTFTATTTPSDRDAKFGFFKRPTKADLLWD